MLINNELIIVSFTPFFTDDSCVNMAGAAVTGETIINEIIVS